jgi:type IV secretion system protein VirB1
MLAAYTLAQLLRTCAPDVGARTMTAIISVESGGNPLAIYDNTLRRSFAPSDTRQAVAWANQLLALHHSVDLGLSQINNANLPRLGLTVPQVFDACTNASAGSLILALDYRAASNQFGPGQNALRHAIGAYNCGSIFGGYAYVDKILAAAGLAASQAIQVPDLQTDPLSSHPAADAHPAADVQTLAVTTAGPVRLVRNKPRTNPQTAPILVTAGLSAASSAAQSSIGRTPPASGHAVIQRDERTAERSAIMLPVSAAAASQRQSI